MQVDSYDIRHLRAHRYKTQKSFKYRTPAHRDFRLNLCRHTAVMLFLDRYMLGGRRRRTGYAATS